MNVFITGGLGFVGTQLSIRLLELGYTVTVVDRSPTPRESTPASVRYVSADTTREGEWQDQVAGHDAVVNLAGVSIFKRWNEETKKQIYDTRILTTKNLVAAMKQGGNAVLCSTSAVGYYGFHGDETLTEEDSPGDDFLASLCVDWEKEAGRAAEKDVRVVLTRFGIVLGKAGGAFRLPCLRLRPRGRVPGGGCRSPSILNDRTFYAIASVNRVRGGGHRDLLGGKWDARTLLAPACLLPPAAGGRTGGRDHGGGVQLSRIVEYGARDASPRHV